MSFFTPQTPKLKLQSLAKNLHSQLDEIRQQRWGNYLNIAGLYLQEGGCIPSEIMDDAHVPSLKRTQKNFSWDITTKNPDENIDYMFQNSKLQFEHYRELVNIIRELEKELTQSSPNYKKIYLACLSIKNRHVQVPSYKNGDLIDIKLNYYTGGTILTNFFGGIVGMLCAVGSLCRSGIYAAALYCRGEHSLYFGTAAFSWDCLSWFINSFSRVMGAVFFPAAILYSKYTTDSFNVFQGETTRTLESMMYLTTQLEPSLKESGLNPNSELRHDQIFAVI